MAGRGAGAGLEGRDARLLRRDGISRLPHVADLRARALDLPSDYFDGLFDDPAWTTRNQHYPPVPAEDNQFGIAPHSDHGFLTLLPVTEEPGLQIRATTGRWLPANTIDGAIIVNTGEFLNRWTNGRFMATPHRVVPTGRDRYSVAFFFNPSWDTVADPLPTCTGPDNPPRFKPVRFLDYRNWYLNQKLPRPHRQQPPRTAKRRGKHAQAIDIIAKRERAPCRV